MRVAIDNIDDKGLGIEEDIPASIWEIDSRDVKFVDKIHLNCNFLKVNKEILVKTKVVLSQIITCSRCLEEIKQQIIHNFDFHYNISALEDYLDMDNDIREEILLNFPMKVLCNSECKGICSGCGVNLNFEECKCGNKVKTKTNSK
ncbi:MAG: DUF177 domain-containing protein [Candidatus Omnitrophica bacterium]|nr:DUF177 domain-containing protein [Candidatus Omnitrophota bacterium]